MQKNKMGISVSPFLVIKDTQNRQIDSCKIHKIDPSIHVLRVENTKKNIQKLFTNPRIGKL